MIFFLLLFLQAYTHETLEMQDEAVFKFPAIHFDHKRSTGEWVALRLTDKVTIVQVSEARLEGANILTFKEPRAAVNTEVLIIAGNRKNREAGLMIKTDKRNIFCTFKSTTEETHVYDTLQTRYDVKIDRSLQSNTPVVVSTVVGEANITCILGLTKTIISLLPNEHFKEVSLFTNADTVAAFQAK
jgi:hypothetical protein